MSAQGRRAGASRRGDLAADEARAEARIPGGLTRRMVAASGLLSLIVGGAFLLGLLAIGDLRGNEERTRHSQEVLIAANQLERLLLDLETGQRGFVLTGQERFLEPWRSARSSFPGRAHTLLALAAFDPSKHRRAAEIVRTERAYLRDYSIPLVNSARRGEASARSVAATAAGKRRVDAIRANFDLLLAAERRAVDRSKAATDSAVRRAYVAAAAGLGGSVALIALYSSYLTRAIVRPVRRAALMAGRLAGGDLGARMPETGAGEIGALEHAFNAMGSSLERGRDELAELAAEQAALRRVATLVARGATPPRVFSSVAQELAQLLGASLTKVLRYEPGGTATIVGGWSEAGMHIPIGSRLAAAGEGVAVAVLRTGRSARTERFDGPAGSVADHFRGLSARSAVGSPITVEGELWGAAIAASTRPESLPPDSEKRLAGFTALVATAIANAEAQAELTASRARIVATADETRRRIERDLHDGAQQQLVSLALQLRTVRAAVPSELQDLDAELGRVVAGVTSTLDELREFGRGIHPGILAERGLGAALKTLARRSAVPVVLDVRADARLPEAIEVGVYYVVSEALTNVAKHAQASVVAVDVEAVEGMLRVSVRDDGVGGADLAHGSGLVGLNDRVEALGGRLTIRSARGAGTALQVELPLGDEDGVQGGRG